MFESYCVEIFVDMNYLMYDFIIPFWYVFSVQKENHRPVISCN